MSTAELNEERKEEMVRKYRGMPLAGRIAELKRLKKELQATALESPLSTCLFLLAEAHEESARPEPAAEGRERIRWTGTMASLAYLFGRLKEEGLIEAPRMWEDVAASFSCTTGLAADKLNASWQNRLGNKYGKPRGAEQIDALLRELP